TLISCAHKFSAICVGTADRGISSESARLWAISVLATRVLKPSWALRSAVAAATVVLPTPPLPRYKLIRITIITPSSGYTLAFASSGIPLARVERLQERAAGKFPPNRIAGDVLQVARRHGFEPLQEGDEPIGLQSSHRACLHLQ